MQITTRLIAVVYRRTKGKEPLYREFYLTRSMLKPSGMALLDIGEALSLTRKHLLIRSNLDIVICWRPYTSFVKDSVYIDVC